MRIQDQMMEERNYWNDSRTQASMFRSCWRIVESGPHHAIIAFDEYFVEGLAEKMVTDEKSENEAFEEVSALFQEHYENAFALRVPAKYEVCGMCNGSGTVVDPNIDCGGLSQEDFYDDPTFAEDYFGGRYDIVCPDCKGKRVVTTPEFPDWICSEVEEWDRGMWDSIRTECMERAMGA